MSTDTIDDLHAAEDHIGVLSALLARVMPIANTIGEHYRNRTHDARDLMRDVEQLDGLASSINATLADPFCRPSCSDGSCSDDCGCQAHPEGEPHHPSDDDELLPSPPILEHGPAEPRDLGDDDDGTSWAGALS
jgi:hypothetical protein